MHYDRVSQERLLRIWGKICKCKVLIDKKCYMFSVTGKENVLIIYRKENDINLKPNDVLSISIIDNAVYAFKTRVRFVKEDVMTYYRLELPKEGIRIQKRKGFRLEKEIALSYKENDSIKDALIKNISAGGVGVAHEEPIDANSEIGLKFKLDDNVLNLKGVVKHSRKEEEGFFTGINFTDIKDSEQEMIMKFVFKETNNTRRRLFN